MSSFPKYIDELFAKKFTPEQVVIINALWWFFADDRMSFGSSSERKILKEAKLVLESYECLTQVEKDHYMKLSKQF